MFKLEDNLKWEKQQDQHDFLSGITHFYIHKSTNNPN